VHASICPQTASVGGSVRGPPSLACLSRRFGPRGTHHPSLARLNRRFGPRAFSSLALTTQSHHHRVHLMHALQHTSSHSAALLPALHCHIHAYHHLACSTYHSHTHIALFMHECSYTHFVEHFLAIFEGHLLLFSMWSPRMCNYPIYHRPTPHLITPLSLFHLILALKVFIKRDGWVGTFYRNLTKLSVSATCWQSLEKQFIKTPSYLSTCHSVLFSALHSFLIRLMHAHSACIPLPPYRGSCSPTCLVQKQFYSHCRG